MLPSPRMQTYDLIVIGSGPARCEVVSSVCINAGALPSKIIRDAVLQLCGDPTQNVDGTIY